MMKEPPRPASVTEAQALFLKAHPACEVCGSTGATQAHHDIPYEYLVACDRVWLASDQRIFTALCETEAGKPEPNHHIAAHGFNFKQVDLHFKERIEAYRGLKTFEEIKASPVYHAALLTRLPHVDKMTGEQIKTLTAFIDAKYGAKP